MSNTVDMAVGTGKWSVTIPPEKLVPLVRREPTAPPSVGHRELMRAALQHTIGMNAPLCRAVTPDDHAVIVVDESLPHVGELVGELLAHLAGGGLQPALVTLLVPAPSGPQTWIDDLPEEFGDVHIEIHDPTDPKKLAYLATTKAGRRVYLNRTLVEAEFVVVFSGRRFDRTTGYTGAEVALFPALSNTETQAEFAKAASADRSKLRAEATLVAWQLGSPVFVQAIEGPGDTLADVVVGLPESSLEGVKRQNARWRGTVASRADLVIAAVGSAPERVTFHDLTLALTRSRNVASADGRLVLLTDAAPTLDAAGQRLRQSDDVTEAVKALSDGKKSDAYRWAKTAKQAHVYVASGWQEDVVEELFATPITTAAELQRLIEVAERVIVIPDAHKSYVEVV
jgi:nickel-dependent lactate racemase